jgi:hypothetical protein
MKFKLSNICKIEKHSNLNYKTDLKTENKNRKRKRGEKPHLDLPYHAAHGAAHQQPIGTKPSKARRSPPYLFVRNIREGVVLIPSSRMEDTTTPWSASPRCWRYLLDRRRDEARIHRRIKAPDEP